MTKTNLLKKIRTINNFLKKKLENLPLSINERILALSSILFIVLMLVFVSLYKSIKNKTPELLAAQAIEKVHFDAKSSVDDLDKQTPLDLSYNDDVEKYIQLYLTRRHNDLEIMLGRSELYFPIIEEYLDRYDLPLELKYLAVLESGLNPLAKSKSGAVGLWQFLYNTCSLVDLEVNSYVDERRDVYKSTDAACRYLKYLYRTFGDWNLALAAYNGGPGEVKKAIIKSGGKTNYWEIRPFLSTQASDYVPAFTAFIYLFNNSQKLGFIAKKNYFNYSDIDTIHINKPVNLSEIAKSINLPIEQIRLLNPIYKKDVIPFYNESDYCLILPKTKISEYLKSMVVNSESVNTSNVCQQKFAGVVGIEYRKCIRHVVQKGDFFHKIAMEHQCTIENIRAWNKIDNIDLEPGQELKIWIIEN